MKIEKGKSYLCIKDIVMKPTKKIEFTEGRIYISCGDNTLTNNSLFPNHFILPGDATKYFKPAPTPTPLSTQIGGDHYKDMPIQPIEYTMKNGLNFCQGNVVKYITRYKEKNGIEDLEKAKHYIDLLIEFETQKPNN